MRIGIGCTTYNRPECLAKWKEQIAKHTSMDNVLIYIAEDTDADRKGVAARKNECLRALRDCDYIFLFDDDTYPIHDGWAVFFIQAHLTTGMNHFLFLHEQHKKFEVFHQLKNRPFVCGSTKKFTANGKTDICSVGCYNDCGGVLMFITKDCVEKVGAFNEKFKTWGFEHAEWSKRVNKAGLNNNEFRLDSYFCIEETDEFIYSADYSDPAHKSSISNEEKKKYFDLNFPKFKEPIKNIYIPL